MSYFDFFLGYLMGSSCSDSGDGTDNDSDYECYWCISFLFWGSIVVFFLIIPAFACGYYIGKTIYNIKLIKIIGSVSFTAGYLWGIKHLHLKLLNVLKLDKRRILKVIFNVSMIIFLGYLLPRVVTYIPIFKNSIVLNWYVEKYAEVMKMILLYLKELIHWLLSP